LSSLLSLLLSRFFSLRAPPPTLPYPLSLHDALPIYPAAKGTRGRGKRVRLFDAAGSTLADYVFGKESKDGAGHRYVRVPDQKQTYAVKVAPEISVKFEDWVETDLLKVGSATVKKVTIDRYSFNV